MQGVLSEPIAGVLGALFYGVVAGVLTVAGVLAEWASMQDLAVGQLTLGAWEAAVGSLLIYAGLSVARDIVLPRLRERSAV
jgi:hypothetical protein